MPRKPLTIATLAILTLIVQPSLALQAQTPPPNVRQDNSLLIDLKTAVLRAIGAQEKDVQIAKTGSTLKIIRVSRRKNDFTAVGRENEASAIMSVISKAILGKEKSSGIATIRIEYVLRPMNGTNKVFDIIEYREDANGAFQHHKT